MSVLTRIKLDQIQDSWLSVLIILAGCGSPTGVSGQSDLLAVIPQDGRLFSVDIDGGVDALGTLGGPVLASALDPVRSVVYFTVITPAGRQLLTYDLQLGRTTNSLPLADASRPVAYNGVQLGGDPIAFLQTSGSLATWAAWSDTIGLATFNPIDGTPLAGRRPLEALGLQELSRMVAAHSPRGTRPDLRMSFVVLLLNPSNLLTIDSISPSPPFEDPGQIVPMPTGSIVIVSNYTQLYAYSISTREVVTSIPRPVPYGYFAISPNGRRIVMTDVGVWPDDPGSGALFPFDFDDSFSALPPIDLAPAATDGGRTRVRTGDITFSRDGRWIFAAAGTVAIGPLYGPQPAQVLVINADSLQLVRAIPLGGFGTPLLFPVH